MLKTVITVVLSFFAIIAVSFVGCGLLVSGGQKAMESQGRALAEVAGWKLSGCRSMFDGSKERMCVLTVNNRRLERAGADLERLGDSLDSLR